MLRAPLSLLVFLPALCGLFVGCGPDSKGTAEPSASADPPVPIAVHAAGVLRAAGRERDLIAAKFAVLDRNWRSARRNRAGDLLIFLLQIQLALRQLPRAGNLGGNEIEKRGAPVFTIAVRLLGDVAVDNQGRLYVADLSGIQVFEADGRYLSTIRTPAYPYGLAFDQDNRLYVVSNNRVYKYQLTADE